MNKKTIILVSVFLDVEIKLEATTWGRRRIFLSQNLTLVEDT